MLCCLAFCKKDQDQADRLARWLIDLGGCKGHEILLGVDSGVTTKTAGAIMALFRESFDKVTVLPINNPYNDWPKAPNFCYSNMARHIEENKLAPYWLWLEADCVFLKAGALDAIEAEYQQVKKPFLGDLVAVDGIPNHMSGIAVYPGQMTRHAGLALISDDVAWDVVGADQILPRMYDTKLIAHSWNHKPFANWEQVEREVLIPHPEALIYHASKDGSLIELLRARNLSGGHADNGGIPRPVSVGTCAAPTAEVQPAECNQRRLSDQESLQPPSQITCDLFLKTFPSDYPWAEYCLRSIDKFCTGFRRVVIIAPDENCPRPKVLPHVVVQVPEKPNGYNWQQVVKLSADQYTDASHILFMDSDCVFTKPVTPQTFIRDGRIMWLMTPFEKAREDQKRAWIPVMTKWLGKEPPFEWMRRHPFMFPRWLFEKVRGFCVFKHGRTLEQYVLEQGEGLTFSEFNCAGFLAYEQFRDQFEWLNTETDTIPEETVLQKWSKGGLTDEIRVEFEKILEAHTNGTTNQPADVHQHNPASHTLSAADDAFRNNDKIIQTKQGWWVLKNDSHISRWIEQNERLDHDQNTLPLILPEIPIGGVVVDAGAFVGDHTIAYCDRVGPNGMVYAFEPNPTAYECLILNMARATGDNIKTQQSAVGEAHGILNVSIGENAGGNYLTKEAGPRVDVVPLDSLKLNRLDFLKLDVEGYELHALKGAEQTINLCRPRMLIEVNEGALARQGVKKSDIYDWLRAHDYEWMPLQELMVADPPQYDILAKPIRKEGDALSHNTPSTVNASSVKSTKEKVGCKTAPMFDPKGAAIPWRNKEDTLAEIDRLSESLRQFCTAPRLTKIVRDRLRKAKVITR